MKKYKLVAVDWLDAESVAGWRSMENVKELTSPVITTVGFLILNNDKIVVVVQSIADGEYLGCTTIPKGMVKRIKIIPYEQ